MYLTQVIPRLSSLKTLTLSVVYWLLHDPNKLAVESWEKMTGEAQNNQPTIKQDVELEPSFLSKTDLAACKVCYSINAGQDKT